MYWEGKRLQKEGGRNRKGNRVRIQSNYNMYTCEILKDKENIFIIYSAILGETFLQLIIQSVYYKLNVSTKR